MFGSGSNSPDDGDLEHLIPKRLEMVASFVKYGSNPKPASDQSALQLDMF